MENMSTRTPDFETQTPQTKTTLTFTNGSLLKHHNQQQLNNPMLPSGIIVSYKECMKNHAASIGGYSLDGCGEFMPSPNVSPSDLTSLKCAACGCHRNFHRREPDDAHHHRIPTPTTTAQFLNFHQRSSSPSLSPKSPPPLQPAYYASAPHMLLALSTEQQGGFMVKSESFQHKRKRFRTKFSREQKEKMCGFADRLGWKMQKSEERLVEEFCKEIGVPRRVFKIWMHNNKHVKKHVDGHGEDNNVQVHGGNGTNGNGNEECKKENFEGNNDGDGLRVSANGSSSSS